jgi:hypothetical protein
METLRITTHSIEGWAPYTAKFGFVPDPMMLRTGEIFLNGAEGAKPLGHSDFAVWSAIEQNIGGLLDFFDMLVIRDAIPLIN